jgi:hypothetical protein
MKKSVRIMGILSDLDFQQIHGGQLIGVLDFAEQTLGTG